MSDQPSQGHWLLRWLRGIWSSVQLLGAVESGERLHERHAADQQTDTRRRQRCPTTRILPAPG